MQSEITSNTPENNGQNISPESSPESSQKYVRKIYTGLVNLGNTCFLNACIQALSYTYEISRILDSPITKTYMNPKKIETELLKEWNELRILISEDQIPASSGTSPPISRIISPNKFVNNVQKIAYYKQKDIFTGWSQNDMPEFLFFMIECIHNSLSRPVKIKISGKSENKTDELAIKCYEMLQKTYAEEYSEIMELFYGIYVSQISVLTTPEQSPSASVSIKPESFFILDLPIRQTPGEQNQDKSSKISLYDCFDLFVKPELLIDENAWYNENTKTYENAKKQILFWNFPKILIITLKRFSPDGTQKMPDLIEFPLENLDLSKYIKGYNASQYVYDLYAVCNHIGNIYIGHYTAFVKTASGEWLHFNDELVENIENPNDIVTPMAYCLFYRKKNKKI